MKLNRTTGLSDSDYCGRITAHPEDMNLAEII
jgi:hypothetical protein